VFVGQLILVQINLSLHWVDYRTQRAKIGFLMTKRDTAGITWRISRETTGLLLGLIGVIIFGATLPATRVAVVDLSPWFVTTGRAAVAGLLASYFLA
jgi:hypothetical protein